MYILIHLKKLSTKTSNFMQNNRVLSLDILRGLAVFLMILYHLSFDLNYFNFLSLDLNNQIFWKLFRYLIIFLFLFSFGYSMILSSYISSTKKILKRIAILFTLASTITIVTYFIFPKSWIYFGILHFILLAYIYAQFLIKLKPITLLAIVIVLYILYFLGFLHTSFIYETLKELLHLPSKSEDLVRFFPWFNIVLIGMAFAKYKVLEKINIKYELKYLKILGQNALLVYMIHQPILFGIIFLLSK